MTLLFDRLKNNQGTLQSLQKWQLGLEPELMVGWQTSFLVICFRFLFSSFSSSSSSCSQTPIYSSWGSAQLWQRGAAPPPATSWGAGSKEPPSNWGAERDRDRLRHDLGGGRLVVVAGVNGVGGENHGWHGDDGDDEGSGGTQFRFSIDANQGSARTAIDLSLSRLLILPLDQTRDHLITFRFRFEFPWIFSGLAWESNQNKVYGTVFNIRIGRRIKECFCKMFWFLCS